MAEKCYRLYRKVNGQTQLNNTKNQPVQQHSSSFDPGFINYDKPLMTCIETLQHNKHHQFKRPAGRLNSIAVPLMTYSSSLEEGTIFAADEPKNIDFSKLPKLNCQYVDNPKPAKMKYLRPVNLNEKQKTMKDKTIDSGEIAPLVPKKTSKPENQQLPNTIRYKNTVSLNMIITTKKRKIDTPILNREAIIHEYKAKSFKTVISDGKPIDPSPEPNEPEKGTEEESNDEFNFVERPAYIDYSTYPPDLVKQEDAHTGGDIQDSSIPLMNDVAKIFDENSPLSYEPSNYAFIDVPLLTCMEILEDSDPTQW